MQSLINDFKDMLNKGIMPLFEVELNNGDYLLVNIEVNKQGFNFTFDSDNKPTYFSSDIIAYHENSYLLPFDEWENLDGHLEMINNEITDGYLLPNNLI